MIRRSHATLIAAALAVLPLVSGCVPALVAGAAAGTALVATDRRAVGAQADDAAIELNVSQHANAAYGDRAHISTTSYNGIVLLTGEVPDQAAKDSMSEFARGTARVRGVQNELVVAPPSELGSRSNDTYITSVVKTRFLEAKDVFSPTHVKVVTDRRVVYLMGLWNAQMMLNEKGYYFTLLMYGLFSAVSLQKSVRDRLEGIPVTGIYYSLCWVSLLLAVLLLTIGLWNATLAASEKGFYAMAFLLALFGAVAVQKNWERDMNDKTRSTSRKITPEEVTQLRAEVAKNVQEIFSEELQKGGYKLATAPGPNTLALQVVIADLYINAPEKLQEGAGRSKTYTFEAGYATLALEARDAETNQLLGRAVDRSEARTSGTLQWTTSVSNRADFRNMFRSWAKTLVKGMDDLKERKPSAAPAEAEAKAAG